MSAEYSSAEEVLLDVGWQCGRNPDDESMKRIITEVVVNNWYETVDDLLLATKNGSDGTIFQGMGMPLKFLTKLLEILKQLGPQDQEYAPEAEDDPEAEATALEAEAEIEAEAEADEQGEASALDVEAEGETEAEADEQAQEYAPAEADAEPKEVERTPAKAAVGSRFYRWDAIVLIMDEQNKKLEEPIFKVIDKDGKGKIMMEDLKAFWSTRNLSLPDEQANEAFQYLDTQNKGHLDESDLQDLILGLLGPIYKCSERTALFAHMDDVFWSWIDPSDIVVGLGDTHTGATDQMWLKVTTKYKVGWATTKTCQHGQGGLVKITDPDEVIRGLDELFMKNIDAKRGHSLPAKRHNEDDGTRKSKEQRVGEASRLSSAEILNAAAAAKSMKEQQEKQEHVTRWSRRVFVGGIPRLAYITEDYIFNSFNVHTDNNIEKVKLRWGSQVGFCFIWFTTPEAAKKFLTSGIKIEEHSLEIRQNEPQLMVGELTQQITANNFKVLRDHFSKFGELVSVERAKSSDNHLDNVAYISFRDVQVTATVLTLRETIINGTTIMIKDRDGEVPKRVVLTSASGNRKTVCWFWQHGICKRGSSCIFAHEE
jgi:hypothetical protein